MKYRYLIILAVSLVCVYILGRHFNFADLFNAIKSMNPAWFVPAVMMYLASIAFRSLRWQVMISSIKPIPLSRLFKYVTLGFMTNNLLPARLGEVVRAYVTGKGEDASRSAMFASIVLERIFDGLTIVLLLVATLAVTGLKYSKLIHVAWVSSLIFGAGFAFLLALTYKKDSALSFAAKMIFFLPKPLRDRILLVLKRFVLGLALLHEPAKFAKVMALSLFVWGCELSLYYIFELALPNIRVTFDVLIFALVFVNLSSMVPALPANALVFQVACSQALVSFGQVEESTALLYSVILHATQIFPVIILGWVFMAMLRLSWKELSHPEIEDSKGSNED